MTDEDVLRAIADNGMVLHRAAKALYCHRNSLVYRVNSIKKKTGLNPRGFFDLLKLLKMYEII